MKRKIALASAAVLLLGVTASAQDAHYWTQYYGTESNLLSGAVIGSVADLGGTFYNPGFLARVQAPTFLLSAKIYQLTSTTVETEAGAGGRVSNSDFGSAPNLVAGTFKLPFMRGYALGYSFLTRQRSENDLTLHHSASVDVLQNFPGPESVGAEVSTNQDMKDEWLGLTLSHALGGKAGIGLTNYLAIRSQTSSYRAQLQALAQNGAVAMSSRINEFNYSTYGVLWKAGVAFDLSPFTAGLTLTTPRLNIAGSGTSLYNEVLTGVDRDGDGRNDDYLASNLQTDVGAQYKSPWSVGAGAGWTLGKTKLHASAEWFDRVDKFDVVEAKNFINQSTGETVARQVTQQLDDVLNYGAGVEVHLNEKFSGYGSFATDFSALTPETVPVYEGSTQVSASSSTWDLLTFAGGTALKVARAEVTLGLSYTFGKQDLPYTVKVPDAEGNNQDFTSRQTVAAKFRRFRFIFAFSFTF